MEHLGPGCRFQKIFIAWISAAHFPPEHFLLLTLGIDVGQLNIGLIVLLLKSVRKLSITSVVPEVGHY